MSGYTLPDGITLKNRVGATNHDELERLQTEPVRRRLLEIELGYGPAGQFDAEHLKAIQHHLFQDVFEWAGHTRDERVALSDGSIATEPTLQKAEGKPFLISSAIPAVLDDIAGRLHQSDLLRGLPREEFAARTADVMAELNAVHAFREGNGRTQRTFMRELAKGAGHTLDFTVVSRERMIQASIAAHEQEDPAMMRRMFDEISDPSRVSLLRASIASLEKLNFPWNDRYLATIAPGHPIDLVLAGIAGDQFMARTNEQILFGRTADLPQPHPERGQSFSLFAPSSKARRLTAKDVMDKIGRNGSGDDRVQDPDLSPSHGKRGPRR